MKYFEKLLIREKIHGEKHEETNDIACTQLYMKQNRQAIECFRKSIAIKGNIDSEDLDFVENSHNSLASVYRDIGEHSQAKELFEKEF